MAPPRRAAALSAASNLAASAASANRSVSGSASTNNKNKDEKDKQQSSKNTSTSQATPSSSSKPPAPLIPLSPIVVRLRQMWKFAAICQFLFTFDEAFGFSGFETDALEMDLDGSETQVIPDLFRRLLYTLTLNRNIDESNWEDHLRKQYINREPDVPLLGTIEEPLPWHGLSLEKKVESIHTLCEWQLWDAERFRKLVKNEEDAEVWRIDPIGWDAEDNTYWLFDDNRLWVQHPPPPPPPTAKAKAPPKKGSKKAKAEARREAQKRKREAEENTAASTLNTPSRNSSRSTSNKFSSAAANRLPRTPPTRSSPRTRMANGESASKQPRSTRSSRRTDEWEQVPPELLYDGDSDLSDPPEDGDKINTDSVAKEEEEIDETVDEKDESMVVDESILDENVKEEAEDEENETKVEEIATNGSTKEETESEVKKEEEEKEKEPEWIEFEALAITRQEWEWMSTRFAKSRHPDEKALHQLLKETVLPKVMADLDEADKQKAHELAMANRKRSSRIALKESEREEKERDRIARQKMEEKMAAIREEEEEKIRKEEEEVNLAKLREERLREREERAFAREREAIERAQREIDEREERERMRELRKLKREQIIANGGQPPEDDSLLDAEMEDNGKDDESWELDCEVCGKHGVNLDDTDEIVCCEECGKWQHTDCWNAFDRRVGRKMRDWENEDFFCSNCRPPAPGQPRPQAPRFQSFANEPTQIPLQPGQIYQSNSPMVPSQAVPQQHPQMYPSAPSAGHGGVNHHPMMQQHPHPMSNQIPPYGNYRPYVPQPYPTNHLPSMSNEQQRYPTQFAPSNERPVPVSSAHSIQQSPPAMSAANVPQERVNVTVSPSQRPHAPAPNPVATAPRPQVPQSQVPPAQVSQTQSPQLQAQQPQSIQSQPSPQMAQASVKPVSVPVSNGSMGAPQQIPNVNERNNHAGQNGSSSSASMSMASSTAPKSPISNGSPSAVPIRSSPGSTNANGSPQFNRGSHQPNLPVRSPGSMNGQTHNGNNAVPRNVSGQPTGSFPLRHTPARSPLSGPHHVSSSSVPSVSIGPPARSGSPSPNRTGQQNTLVTGRPPQLNHELLHGRQPSIDRSTAPSPSPQPNVGGGPGPSSGSLARPNPQAQSSPNRPLTSLPSLATAVDRPKVVSDTSTNTPSSLPPQNQAPIVGNISSNAEAPKQPIPPPSSITSPGQQKPSIPSSYPIVPTLTSQQPKEQIPVQSQPPPPPTSTTSTSTTMQDKPPSQN